MPLLIRGLDLPDIDIRTKIFDTLLGVVAGGDSEMVSEHASTLVSAALRCALTGENSSTVCVQLSPDRRARS
jgi:DNA repair/transcription protein MET18/MMS19